jgi:hypothetical protein
MTCVAGIVEKGTIYLGADSCGSDGRLSKQNRKDEKVFVSGEFVMGFTSSFRMGQVLRYNFNPPPIHDEALEDLMRYMVGEFIPAVRNALKEAGYTHIEDNVEDGGTFLVGVRGRLFQVENDFQVGERHEPYTAIGCGDDLALGALFVTKGSPRQRLKKALEAAEKFSAGVQRPFNFVQTP